MLEVKIDGWQKGIRFSSAHTTPELGRCERLHGHTYALHAVIEGQQNELGIVYDFVEITRALREIADGVDHRVLVPTRGKRTKVRLDGNQVVMETAGPRRYSFPKDDCVLLPTPTSTAEDLCLYVLSELRKRIRLPKGVTSIRVGVDEGYGQGAWTTWKGNKGGRR